jgi:hypothetical protein
VQEIWIPEMEVRAGPTGRSGGGRTRRLQDLRVSEGRRDRIPRRRWEIGGKAVIGTCRNH